MRKQAAQEDVCLNNFTVSQVPTEENGIDVGVGSVICPSCCGTTGDTHNSSNYYHLTRGKVFGWRLNHYPNDAAFPEE